MPTISRAARRPLVRTCVPAAAGRALPALPRYALPRAIIKLRQGFGRLIRTRSDRGAVVILDRRVIDRWYGRVFLNALPKAAPPSPQAQASVLPPRKQALIAQSAMYRPCDAKPPQVGTPRPPPATAGT